MIIRVRRVTGRVATGAAALALAAGLLAGCVSPEDTPNAGAASDPAVLDGEAGPSPSSTADIVADADSGQPPAVLSTVRTVAVGSVDRITLVFQGSFDGYTVGYVDKVVNSTLEKKVTLTPADLGGESILRIHVRSATTGTVSDAGAGAVTETLAGATPYPGPTSTSTGLTQLKDYAIVGDDGADLTVAVGVAQRSPFIVLEMASPARLVVEVARS